MMLEQFLAMVRDEIGKALDEWESAVSHDRFAWPDDVVAAKPWAYWVHCEWVVAWNDEGRQSGAVAFLREWIASDENLECAFRKWRKWERGA